jgi:hypothetical protein
VGLSIIAAAVGDSFFIIASAVGDSFFIIASTVGDSFFIIASAVGDSFFIIESAGAAGALHAASANVNKIAPSKIIRLGDIFPPGEFGFDFIMRQTDYNALARFLQDCYASDFYKFFTFSPRRVNLDIGPIGSAAPYLISLRQPT